MKFYSTRNKEHRVDLKEAVVRGLAPDNGLYLPEVISSLSPAFFKTISERTFEENAFEVARTLLGDQFPDKELHDIIHHTIQFDAPLVEVDDHIYSLELFHGPTMAFKDFGARFMSQLLGHFAKAEKKQITILVATSGDTGSAVANGFLGVEGVRILVLYPSGKVSDIQEKQFTTLGQNITAIEVNGTFDDCQQLVKTAFQDTSLTSEHFLTSANSINIARLIPQTFYYFHAYAQLKDKGRPLIFAVPSGNFGNLTGAIIAKRMGLPIDQFIVATNDNDVVPQFLQTGIFKARTSVQTISNAMDVGNPSNFERMMELYGNNLSSICTDIRGYAISEKETIEQMKSTFTDKHYLLDPHGAVALAALYKHLRSHDTKINAVFLETAHPGKFKDVVEKVIGQEIELPSTLRQFMTRQKTTVKSKRDYESFKSILKEVL